MPDDRAPGIVPDPNIEAAARIAVRRIEDEPMATARSGREDELDRSLRPPRLSEFVAQEQVTSQLEVFIEAARRRGEPLDHVLLSGPPGLGKTTLAHIIAAELGAPLVHTAAPALERKGDIAAFLTSLEPNSVFFIDEIHRLNPAIEETLYPAMEDRRLPVVLGQGAGARTVTLDLPPFTLVGATTRAGLLSKPLHDRFGVSHRLEHYEAEDLAKIVRRSAEILGVEIEPEGETAISLRSRGTPRVANRLLRRVRDFAEVKGTGVVTGEIATGALGLLEVDEAGLDRHDRLILGTIAGKFAGGPVGLSTLSAAVDEEQDTIEDVYEPYLLQQGLVKRTPRGRVLTERGYAHLGMPVPDGAATLF
jgi:Holliday junction DNA helicase RuvB